MTTTTYFLTCQVEIDHDLTGAPEGTPDDVEAYNWFMNTVTHGGQLFIHERGDIGDYISDVPLKFVQLRAKYTNGEMR